MTAQGKSATAPAYGGQSTTAPTQWVQQALNQVLGLRLAVDGSLGPVTRSALRTFQQSRRLRVDGAPNPQTIAALRSALGNGGRSPGQPCAVLHSFDFDRSTLKPAHRAQVASVARSILQARRAGRPLRVVRLVGHTDPVGNAAYNMKLGERRAQQVADELRRTLEQMEPGSTRGLALSVESRGEQEPIANDAAKSRRVEVCYPLTRQPRQPRQLPPDRHGCGVPQRSGLAEIVLETELETGRTGRQQAAAAAVRARLCLFQNPTISRSHFECGAGRLARRIGAIGSPDASACRRRIGPTPYDTGADIIRAIEAARACLGRAVDAVHIFSHSGSHGVFGPLHQTVGLYSSGVDASSRAGGGREVADIPTAPLANNVVFVLHGCKTASGSSNFARALYRHLARTLTNPTVYGHYESACASQGHAWREYSNRHPAGRKLTANPHYTDVGCCKKQGGKT